MTRKRIATLVLVLLVVTTWYAFQPTQQNEPTPPPLEMPESRVETIEKITPAASTNPENTVEFICKGGTSFTAVFVRDIAGITLSDGRQFELRELTGGDEVAYTNAYERIELRGSELGTRILEDGTPIYTDCIAESAN